MLFLEVRHQVECVRNLAAIVEYVNTARRHDPIWELRLWPADVQRRDDMEEQVCRNAARIIPILAEPEKTVRIEGALGSGAQPHFPIDVVVPFSVGTGIGVDLPVPFAFDGVSMVGALAHQHLADHAIRYSFFGFPPLLRGSSL